MPIIKQAKKKMRRDNKRVLHNAKIRKTVREHIKAVRENPTKKTLTAAFTTLDKAAKRDIIHANKASRLKSRLTKLVAKK